MTPHKCPVCDGKGIRPDDSEDCFACDATGVVWAEAGGEQKVIHEHHYYHHGAPYYPNAYPWTYTTSSTGVLGHITNVGTATISTDADGISDNTWTNMPTTTTSMYVGPTDADANPV